MRKLVFEVLICWIISVFSSVVRELSKTGAGKGKKETAGAWVAGSITAMFIATLAYFAHRWLKFDLYLCFLLAGAGSLIAPEIIRFILDDGPGLLKSYAKRKLGETEKGEE